MTGLRPGPPDGCWSRSPRNNGALRSCRPRANASLSRAHLALLIAEPNEENATAILERISQLMTEFVSDRDFIDMLRVLQVAILQGELAPEQLATLRDQLTEEFPAGDAIMNRELVRLLVYLQASSIMDRYFDYLHSRSR